MTSKFFRNSLTQYQDERDNNSFRIPSHEIDAIERNLQRKEKKIAFLWYALIVAGLFVVGTFSLTLASGYIANEESKESHVKGGVMETLGGDPVSTGDLESFSSLFDLPNYDAYTLSKITHLSVRLNEEKTGSFEIASVVKSKLGSVESVTLFTTEGNRIIVDSATGMAAVYVLPCSRVSILTLNQLERIIQVRHGGTVFDQRIGFGEPEKITLQIWRGDTKTVQSR